MQLFFLRTWSIFRGMEIIPAISEVIVSAIVIIALILMAMIFAILIAQIMYGLFDS